MKKKINFVKLSENDLKEIKGGLIEPSCCRCYYCDCDCYCCCCGTGTTGSGGSGGGGGGDDSLQHPQ